MRSSNTPGTKKSSSDTFLKTTTWGALIALSLVAGAVGYYGPSHWETLGSRELVTEPSAAQASDSPVQAPAERNAARTSRSVESKQVLSATTVWGARNG